MDDALGEVIIAYGGLSDVLSELKGGSQKSRENPTDLRRVGKAKREAKYRCEECGQEFSNRKDKQTHQLLYAHFDKAQMKSRMRKDYFEQGDLDYIIPEFKFVPPDESVDGKPYYWDSLTGDSYEEIEPVFEDEEGNWVNEYGDILMPVQDRDAYYGGKLHKYGLQKNITDEDVIDNAVNDGWKADNLGDAARQDLQELIDNWESSPFREGLEYLKETIDSYVNVALKIGWYDLDSGNNLVSVGRYLDVPSSDKRLLDEMLRDVMEAGQALSSGRFTSV